MPETLLPILEKYWGYQQFRPLQEDIIRASLAGHDVLALLPTGGGKSICFQIPALAQDGLCLVISPLIALMKDQVQNLQRRRIAAEAIFSGLNSREIDRILNNAALGKLKFLYVSPERLKTETFQARLADMRICLVAIDEAHCISQWGYDFRPPYLQIAELRQHLPQIPFLALTASATDRVKKDIQDKLQFKSSAQIFQQSFRRLNLSYSAFWEEDKERKMLEILDKVPGTAIVYVRSRQRTAQYAEILQKHQIAADFYHAGLPAEARNRKQQAWIANRTRVIVATNAFGMGIDKPDVRTVIHLDLPDSLEAYYQEAGRGGRDQKRSFAVLLYNTNDISQLQLAAEQHIPPIETIKSTYLALGNYYNLAVGAGADQTFDFDLSQLCKTYQLSPRTTLTALEILQEHNYILLNDAVFKPSRVWITADKTALYQFEVANKRLEPYLKTLLRLYGGLFDNFTPIKEIEIAKALKVPEDYVKNALSVLQSQKVLIYEPQNDKPTITYLAERIDSNNLYINPKLLAFRREVHQKNIAAVIEYAQNKRYCRSQLLVGYFGEFGSAPCGSCDVCVQKKKAGLEDELSDRIANVAYTQLNDNITLPFNMLIERLEAARFNKQDILKTLRWLLDNESILLDENQQVHLGKV